MRQNLHDTLVDRLENILKRKKYYNYMWKFFEYCRNGQIGEVDLLAMNDEFYSFYEVKCNFHNKSHKKAKYQYDKFKKAFPNWESEGFIYTPRRGLLRL